MQLALQGSQRSPPALTPYGPSQRWQRPLAHSTQLVMLQPMQGPSGVRFPKPATQRVQLRSRPPHVVQFGSGQSVQRDASPRSPKPSAHALHVFGAEQVRQSGEQCAQVKSAASAKPSRQSLQRLAPATEQSAQCAACGLKAVGQNAKVAAFDKKALKYTETAFRDE